MGITSFMQSATDLNRRNPIADQARRSQVRRPKTLASPEANTVDGVRRSPRCAASNPAQRRLFLLATALVVRGMEPNEAYIAAFYYVFGPGRGRNWLSALAEQEPTQQV
jgi:hypothetical protein